VSPSADSRLPVICAVALLASIASAGARAAEWRLQPSTQLYALGESNPRMLLSGAKFTESGVADVSLDLRRRSETLEIGGTMRADLRRYSQDVSLDRDEARLDFTLQQTGERISWQGGASVARDTTLTSELGTTGISQVNLRLQAIDLTLGPNWQITERASAGATLSWQDSSYPGATRTDLVDNRYQSASVNAAYGFTEKALISLVASAGELDADRINFRTRNSSVVLQARYRWSPRWTLTAFAGPSWVRSKQASDSGTRYNLELTRQQSERTVVSLLLSRSIAPTGRGFLTQRDDISVRLGRALSEHLDAAFSYGLIRSRDLIPAYGFSFNDVRYTRADASLSWRLAEHWSTVLGAGRSEQQYRVLGSAASNFDARLAIAWTGNPHVY
jgi:hypothetical protein